MRIRHPSLILAIFLVLALGGCRLLRDRPSVALYAPVIEFTQSSEAAAPVDWRLALARTRASGPLTTPRIMVLPTPTAIEVYPLAEWSEPPVMLVEDALMQAFETDGRVAELQRSGAALGRDFELTSELRAFQLELADGPVAVLRLRVDLVRYPEGRLVASRVFEERVPARGQQVADAVAALGESLDASLPQVVDWTVTAAADDWRAHPVVTTSATP